jgi:hypothetical protein
VVPEPVADDAGKEQEKAPSLSPKDLFGDAADDVPTTSDGGSLFDHNDNEKPAT